MKKIFSMLFLSILLIAKSQVGIGTDTPSDRAMLHIVSPNNNQGVLIPSMTTAERDANILSSSTAIDDGLLIYNTTEKCYNYYQLTKAAWISLCGDSSASYGITCASAVVYGNYTVGTSLKSTNYITVPVTVTTAGAYTIVAESGNGYYFEKTGTFPSAGTYTVTLNGTGTPTTEGTDTLTFSLNGVTDTSCTSATVAVAASEVSYTINCNGITVNGTYDAGIMLDAASNTITIPLKIVETAGNVSITTTTNNGVRFYSTEAITTSSTLITLVGVGTPSMAGTYEYTFKTNGADPETCTFEVTFVTTKGTFANPANRCKDIYDLGETEDGEYWILDSSGGSPTKTYCDMTNGGYTLVWSYSEYIAYNTYTTTGTMPMTGANRLNQDLAYNNVTTESGTMNYYNFRLPLATMTNINDQSSSIAPLRVRITEDPTDMNDSWSLQNFAVFTPTSSTYSPISTSASGYLQNYPTVGKIFGQTLNVTSSGATYANATATYYFYYGGTSTYPNHMDMTGSSSATFIAPDGTTTIRASIIDNMFGYFGQTSQPNHHFGKCGGSTGDETSFATSTCNSSSLYPHASFNNGQGRILQWFIK